MSYEIDIYAALEEKAKYLRVINELALGLLQRSTVDDILWMVAKTAIANLGFEDCVIYLIDETGDNLVQRAAHGPKNPAPFKILDPIIIPKGDGIVGTVAATGKPEIVFDTRDDPRYIVDDDARLSELAVPIIHEDRVIGVIDSEHPKKAFYTQEHLEILVTIASIASHKIATALLVEQLEHTKEALRIEEQRYRALYHYHPSMFFTVDVNGIVRSVNDFTEQSLGYSYDEIVGRGKALLHPPEDRDNLRANMDRCFRAEDNLFRWESHLLAKDGTAVRVRETARAIDMPGNEGRFLLVVSEDITEAHELAQQLEFQAAHDPLTGVLNRREFEQRLADLVARRGDSGTVAVLGFIDVDRFKIVNDICGHVAGDELLRQVAGLLQNKTRGRATVGRLGGDEFGLLVQGVGVDNAVQLCEDIRQALESRRFSWQQQSLSLAASIGVVALSDDIGSVSEALSAADAACYAAKRHGRNRVYVYKEDGGGMERQSQEASLVKLLQESLDEDRILLYFQPIFDSRTLRDCRFGEVLARLQDASGEILHAAMFIPLADRYDLIERLDRVVISKTFAMLAQQPRHLTKGMAFSVNVSGRSIGEPEFLDYVVSLLRRHSFDHLRLCFEITETAAVSNLDNAQRFIDKLRGYGCEFALDDFGSAFSSFVYLKHLHVDFLKIEGSFVREVRDDNVNIAIIRSINEIGHLLGKRIIAESVEDDQELGVLQGIGVDFVQGLHLGAPVPLADYLRSRTQRLFQGKSAV